MTKELIIKLLKMNKGETTEQLLPKIMENIKPSLMKNDDGTNDEKNYKKFSNYRGLWNKDRVNGLKANALKGLMNYFGYVPVTIWLRKEDIKNESNKNNEDDNKE